MGISIREIAEVEIWNGFVKHHPAATFLQTWEWGNYQASLKKKIYRLGIYDHDELIGVALCIEEAGRWGKYIYCPRGPVIDWEGSDAKEALEALTDYFRGQNYFCLRIDPAVLIGQAGVKKLIREIGFRSAAKMMQVARTWVLDLPGDQNLSEDQLMQVCKDQGMAKSLPRHIRKAVKEEVQIRFSTDLNDISHLEKVMQVIINRKGLASRGQAYKAQFAALKEAGCEQLLIAELGDQVVGALLVSIFNGEVATLHGGVMPGLEVNDYAMKRLYWEAIVYANQSGCRRFNFWGILPDSKMKEGHPRYGYSVFKQRFGGHAEDYFGTMDYVYDRKRYYPNYLLDLYRQKRYQLD